MRTLKQVEGGLITFFNGSLHATSVTRNFIEDSPRVSFTEQDKKTKRQKDTRTDLRGRMMEQYREKSDVHFLGSTINISGRKEGIQRFFLGLDMQATEATFDWTRNVHALSHG